jgi:EpsD family peptidyl-prolyl cis-trans isomerase
LHDALPSAMIKKILVLSMSIAVAMGLCSCGKPDIRQTTSRIAARVNGEEVSVHQIDSVFARNNSMTPEQAGRAAALARERIIDQELLVQEALQARLNRDARVAQAIERARRQILAQAYIERAVISAPLASPEEISNFYKDNPALFKQRRIYRVLELVVLVAPERSGAFQEAVAGKKNFAELVLWLDSQKLPFDTATSSRAAEQIPMNVLRRLSGMHDGQIAVFPTPRGVSVVRLEQSAAVPLSEKQATLVIARYLHNRKRLELAQAEVTKLRERAKIDYDGIEPVRAAAQTAGRAQPELAGPRMAHNTRDFAESR